MACATLERVFSLVLEHTSDYRSPRAAGEAIGQSGDEGIDGTINEDRLGLDTIYIQAKR